MESCGVARRRKMAAQRLATVGCAFRAAALYKTWHGGSWGRTRPRRPGYAPAAASCGELKAQIAKQPICQARTLGGRPALRPVPAEPWRDQDTTLTCRSRPEPTSPFHRKVGSPTCKAKPARRDYQQFGVRGIVRLLHGTPSQHRLDLSHAIQHKRAAKPAPASGQQPQSQPSHETTAHETTAPQILICRSSRTSHRSRPSASTRALDMRGAPRSRTTTTIDSTETTR